MDADQGHGGNGGRRDWRHRHHRRNAGKQQAPTAGAGDEKTDVRADYEDKILEIGDHLAALASKTENANLAAGVNLTRSGVGKLSADDLEKAGRRVGAAG